MSELRVLVVDDDPWILRMVSASLGKKGNYIVDTARDGQQALSRVQANLPALIVTDVMMPVMDGWTLVQRLRAQPEYAHIPVLFLTALGKDESRLQMLGLAPQDYICKPFRFEELERRVAQSLASLNRGQTQSTAYEATTGASVTMSATYGQSTGVASRPTAVNNERTPVNPRSVATTKPTESPSRARALVNPVAREATPEAANRPSGEAAPRHSALDGRLEQLGLSSLLVMMEMERKDGVLSLWEQAHARTGRIFLRQGRVVHARVDQDPQLPGRDSVYEMLRWKQGRFSFNAMEVEMEDTVNSSTTGLLMEGARLIDEANRDA